MFSSFMRLGRRIGLLGVAISAAGVTRADEVLITKDAWIQVFRTENNGSHPLLALAALNRGDGKSAFLEVEIPPGAMTAELVLSQVEMNRATTVSLHRVTAPWDEETIAWHTRPAADSRPFATFETVAEELPGGHRYSIDITEAIVPGEALSIELRVAQRWGAFCSSDHPDAALRPFVLISYCGGGENPVGDFEDSRDIGGPPTPGSTVYDPGDPADPLDDTYTLSASGADLWDDGDEFHFAYRQVESDFVATARITSRVHPPTNGRWGRHGLMARYSCEPDAKYSMIQTNLASPGQEIFTPRYAFRLKHLESGPNRDHYQVDDGTFPNEGRLPTWMRLMRRGNAIYGYLAESDPDDPTRPDRWRLVGSDVDPRRPGTLLVGMALTAHTGATGVQGAITFDRFQLEPLPREVDPVSCEERIITADFDGADGSAPPGGVVVSRGNFAPVVTGGRLRMAQDGVGDSANAVWFPTDGHGLGDRGFCVEFDVFMRKGNGDSCDPASDPNPADGVTLAVVQGRSDDPFLDITTLRGDGGGGLGYAGGTLLQRTEGHPSFAVEFDNWVGSGEPTTDPPDGGAPDFDCNYHVGLDVNSSTSSLQTNVDLGIEPQALPEIFSPLGARFRVTVETTGRIEVVAIDPGVPVLEAYIPPLEGDVLIGFTAATGGASSTLEVDGVRVSASPPRGFRRGDSNSDRVVDISDAINTLSVLFLGQGEIPCEDAADSNDDGGLDISDAINTLSVLFVGTGEIPPPGRLACGPDPTKDPLSCEAYDAACD